MKKSASRPNSQLLRSHIHDRLGSVLLSHGFVIHRGEFVRIGDDYRCRIAFFSEFDHVSNSSVIEALIYAGYKSLCDAWLSVPGVSNPNGLSEIGFGGHLTQLFPVEPLFYTVESPTSIANVLDGIAARISRVGMPFFEEFSERSRLVRVWEAAGHPFAKIEGREIQLAAALVECFGERRQAELLVQLGITRLQKERDKCQRPLDAERITADIAFHNGVLDFFTHGTALGKGNGRGTELSK